MRAVLAGPREMHDAYYRLRTCVAGLDRQNGGRARATTKATLNARPGEGSIYGSTPDALAQDSVHLYMSELFRLSRLVSSFSMPRVRLAIFV